MPNILLLNDFSNGGGAEGVFNMTAEIVKENYNVFTYTALDNIGSQHSSPMEYIYSRKHKKNIENLIREHSIDIVHVHNFRWLTPSMFAAVKNIRKQKAFQHLKLIVTAHDYTLACPNSNYGYYENGKLKMFDAEKTNHSYLFKTVDKNGFIHSTLKKIQWYFGFKFMQLQNEIDLIITPSRFLKNVLHKHYSSQKIAVIYNPVTLQNNPAFQSVTNSNIVKMIFAGRLSNEKGVVELCEMLSKITDINYYLDIYGSGPEKENIEIYITENHLKNKITLKGHVNNLKELMPQYDAFIMSSLWYENAPLSIVEAATAGLKLIVPDVGGMKEMAELCGNAYFYSIHQVSSLQSVLEKVNQTPFNDNSTHIKNIFSTAKYKMALLNTYDKLLEN